MQFLKIVGLGVLAAIGYGIIHDQVTVRVCLEYFTIFHPRLISSTSPTLLALAWGVAATWWVGLPLGLGLAVAARAGTRPKVGAAAVAPSVLVLLGIMASCALMAGLTGYLLARLNVTGFDFYGEFGDAVPFHRHPLCFADLWAHNASYLSGIVGGIIVIVRTYRRRGRALVPSGLTSA